MVNAPNSKLKTPNPVSPWTWLGLGIALLSLIVVRQAILQIATTLTVPAAIYTEALDWISVLALLFIILRGERLPLSSVGIGVTSWLKSLAWAGLLIVAAIIAGTVAGVIAVGTHFQRNEFAQQLTSLPVWLLIVTCVRGGVAEELCYRGYAIERLQAIGLNRFWAAAIPLSIFVLGHWTTGWLNMLNALLIGSVFSLFYLWRRDLVANIIAHFIIDFISVVIPRLVSG